MGRVIGKKVRIGLNDAELERAAASAVGSASAGYELDMKLRELEISQLTQRNNFFMIFQGVMIAGLLQSQGTAPAIVNFMACLAGTLISIFQIGMAGGAKYWQSRWESAARSSEIAILLNLARAGKDSIQTFTHDISLLSDEERDSVDKCNQSNTSLEDRIVDLSGFIDERVMADITGSPSPFKKGSRIRWVRYKLDWWVRNLGISSKWSVSRIPLWVGAVMFLFWMILWLHTWRISFIANALTCKCEWISFAPLK